MAKQTVLLDESALFWDSSAMNSHAAKFSAALSLIEVGLGSFLHALHVPFRGQVLSMNQGFLLSRASFTGAASRREGMRLSNLISLTAACLKSLSPAGKTLTPMLAISIQGLLFSVGQAIGGVSLVGHSIGISLISLWALTQGLVLGWLLNGEVFLRALGYAIDQLGFERAEWIVGIGVFLLLVLGVVLVFFSQRMTPEAWKKYEARFTRSTPASARSGFSIPGTAFISVGVTLLFIYFTQSPEARTIWIWIRPIAVLIGLRIVVYWISPSAVTRVLSKRWPALGATVQESLNRLNQNSEF